MRMRPTALLLLLAACSSPSAPLPTSADLLIVLSKADGQAALVDPVSLRVLKKLATGVGPHEVAVTPDGNFAFVANYGTQAAPGHTLTMLDLRRRAIADTIELGTFTRPHGIAVSRDGQTVWVTCEGARAVIEVDVAMRKIAHEWSTGQDVSHMLVPGPDELKLYVANIGSGSCTIIERASGTVRSMPTGGGAEGIDYVAGRGEVWVANRESNDLVVMDARTDTLLARIPNVGQMPIRIQFTPNGREAWVSNAEGHDVSVYDTATRARLAAIPVGTVPVGIEIEPNGKRAFVANTGSNQITVIDVRTRKVVKTFTTGREPDGMAWAAGVK